MLISGFYPGIGGGERQAQRLSKALIASGWSVRVLTRRHTGYPDWPDLPPKDVVDGIPLTRLYSRGSLKIGASLYVLNGLWHLLRRGRSGIYHAHDIGTVGWLAVAARYLLGGRCFIKLRSGRLYYKQQYASLLARWQFSTLLRLADKVIVVNSEVEQLLSEMGIPEQRVIRIPNSVDTDNFRPPSAEEKLAVRRRLGLSVYKAVLLYVGRLDPIKGVDVLLRAWALVPEHLRAHSQLVLVGDGAERENLLHLANSLNMQESVSLTGLQQAVRDYYWASDVFVLPSRTEGMSNSMVEAMACGLPVVASNVGGALDLVQADGNGLLFESEDQRDLAQKLGLMLNMADRWPDMGTQARQMVTTYADLDSVVLRLTEPYLESG
jgi:glycosyltransferase involved in cell wall biosynthesis